MHSKSWGGLGAVGVLSFACGNPVRNFAPEGNAGGGSNGGAADTIGGNTSGGGQGGTVDTTGGSTTGGSTSGGNAGTSGSGTSRSGSGGSNASSGGVGGSSSSGGSIAADGSGGRGGAGGSAGTSSASPCAANPCLHGACSASGATFACACDNGYSGTTCSVNTNDCAPNPCANGTQCVDGVASFSCNCATSGYAGLTCNLPRFEALFPGLGGEGVWAISTDGSIVVGGGGEGVKWTHAGGAQVVTVCGGDLSCALRGVTADGAVFVGSGDMTAGAFRVVNGATVSLPPPVPLAGCNGPSINGPGTIVVATCSSNVAGVAVRWLQGAGGAFVGAPLPAPVGGVISAGISTDGANIAGNYFVGNSQRGLFWTAKPGTTPTYTELGVLINASFSEPRAISGDGSTVVGSADSSSGATLAFRWSQGTGLQGLPFDIAYGVNADGSVIVGSLENDAVVWSAALGVRSIRAVLLAAGVPATQLNGWILGAANAVSADGKTIAGVGSGPPALGDSWIARLP